MNVKEAYKLLEYQLKEVYSDPESRSIARIVFEDLYGITDIQGKGQFKKLASLEETIDRLLNNEPIQYIVGLTNFFGLDFKVNQHVLIPRPETEELVYRVLSEIKGNRQLDILDIGTGSGCICVTLKKKAPFIRAFGIEFSLDALNVSRINSRRLKAPVQFYRLNFLDREMWSHLGRFDVIVSNPPYIGESERSIMADNVLKYEPEMALFAKGDNPLVFYEAIAEFCLEHLNGGGLVFVELNEFYIDDVYGIFSSDRVKAIDIAQDMQGKDRIMKVRYN